MSQTATVFHPFMKFLASATFILLSLISFGQVKQPTDFELRHFQTLFKGDTVNVLVKSKRGEDQKPKPLLLFCQGSLPQPLIKYDEKGALGVFTFNPDSLNNYFHLAIVGKPFIPVLAHLNTLVQDFAYRDSLGVFPRAYTDRNYLDYYVERNIYVIRFLKKQKWISSEMLVIAGHSEGSTIAAKLAYIYPGVTHLIYSGGNPMGRITTMVLRERAIQTDSTKSAEGQFNYWRQVVADKKTWNQMVTLTRQHMAFPFHQYRI